VRIEAIAAGGDGVGRLGSGRVVFVPRTAPGDLVDLTRVRAHRRFARAWVRQVVEPGPARISPRCAHYERDACGGCQLQHLAPEAQLSAKQAIVGDTLRRLGRIEIADPPIAPAPRSWGYRTKLTLAVAADGGRIGLHRVGRPDEVFDLVRCEIAAEELQSLWDTIRSHRRVLPAGLTHLVLRLDAEGGRHLILRTAPGAARPAVEPLGARLGERGVDVTIWWAPAEGAPRALFGSADPYPGVVFEQINPGFARRIRDFAVDRLGDVDGRRVWDLYAGIGETTDILLARGALVDSVERDPRAVDLAERAARRAGGRPESSQRPEESPVTRHVGRVEDRIGQLPRPELVITNPPRIGMAERVTSVLLAARPARIAYVSCDPATLARDAARLASAYRLEQIHAFDLFPQTAHVETVALLEARA
jgi:23S rRNA (uracil1939-C5)-methyltransferase